MIFGLILAGGRSSRFGRDKATASLSGRPLIAWVAGALQAGTVRLGVSAAPGSPPAAFAADAGLTCLPDPAGSPSGPLSGVGQGLRWAKREGACRLVTAPCDVPFLPFDYVGRLTAADRGAGAVATTTRGLEPLCAIWPLSALSVLEGLDDHPPIRRVLEDVGAAHADFPDADAFANLNTPEAFATAERRVAERRDMALRTSP